MERRRCADPRRAREGSGEAGATMVEYAIGLILIVLTATAAVRFFGNSVKQKYDCAGARLDDMSGAFVKAGCTGNVPPLALLPSPLPVPPSVATPPSRPVPPPRTTPQATPQPTARVGCTIAVPGAGADPCENCKRVCAQVQGRSPDEYECQPNSLSCWLRSSP